MKKYCQLNSPCCLQGGGEKRECGGQCTLLALSSERPWVCFQSLGSQVSDSPSDMTLTHLANGSRNALSGDLLDAQWSLQCHALWVEPAHLLCDVSTWGLRLTPGRGKSRLSPWDDTRVLFKKKKKKKSSPESSLAGTVPDTGEDGKCLVSTHVLNSKQAQGLTTTAQAP